MPLLTRSKSDRLQPPPFPVRRFTVDEYHRMIQAGVLTEHDDVELLDGWIVPKMARNPKHDTAIEMVEQALRSRLPAGWRVRVQSAITTRDSEPEPDIAVVRGPVGCHADRHPAPSEIALVVEVADSTVEHDRETKGPLYARAGIAIYWLVNLVDSRVEVYTAPSGSRVARYRQRCDFQKADTVPLVVAGRAIAAIPVIQLVP